MANLEDYIDIDDDSVEKANEVVGDDVENKRESLKILAVMGNTKDYIGTNLSLGDVIKLPDKDVEKYFTLYQAASGKELTAGLVKSGIQAVIKGISYLIPIDNPEELCKDLQNDLLVKRELSSAAGLLVVKGGRAVAIASGLFHVAKHTKLGRSQEIDNEASSEPKQLAENS